VKPAAADKTDSVNRSVRSAVIGSSIVLWILAVFMINIMNSINGKLDDVSRAWRP